MRCTTLMLTFLLASCGAPHVPTNVYDNLIPPPYNRHAGIIKSIARTLGTGLMRIYPNPSQLTDSEHDASR